MKILYVDLIPGWGGSLVSLERLLPRLDRPAFEATILMADCNPSRARFEAHGIPVLTVPTFVVEAARSSPLVRYVKGTPAGRQLRTGWLWASARGVRDTLTRTLPLTWRLYRALRTARPDLVHVNDAIFGNRPAIAAAWLARVPAICHVRSLGRLGLWDRLWAKTLAGLVFISRCVAGDVAAQGVTAPHSRVVYDGLDMTAFASLPDRATARRALGLPLAAPVVLVLGRLVPWKGQDLFLRAMRHVTDVMPQAVGVIAGEPESYCLEFEPALRALAAELGLAESVRFAGFVRDPRTLLAAADLLAHTSISAEPFGLVMLEAMAAGRPVVTPAEGGGPEIVADGVTGYLYRPCDAAALADAILKVLADPVAGRMGAAGQARVAEMFTLEQFVADMMQFYREIAGRGGATPPLPALPKAPGT
ncbi:MAG: glycosyltransferase family 4 protein [Chloroflexi bacterium]|nr:glycosyltransferase family 4 protein [Chloroflexota bacterium]